ncbi:MAG: hypothetical protein NZ528_02020 [Caldilineales bacterium]|nr:hypothetical protein [Caldilineales bacterium]MDW8317070.1 V-type ATP synthase subunit F [Anaerolineae bacterium]
MARLIVVTTPELAPGFQLTGAVTLAAGSARAASALVRELLQRKEEGIIAVHEPYWQEMDLDLRRRLERIVNPVVIPLPTGRLAAAPAERRAAIAAMLRQVIGYRITLPGEEATAK